MNLTHITFNMMKQFLRPALVSIFVLFVLAAACGKTSRTKHLKSHFKEISPPFETKIDIASTADVTDSIDEGPYADAVHVLGWLASHEEVVSLFYLTKHKDCIAAKIRTYKDDEIVDDLTISYLSCEHAACGAIVDQRLAIFKDGHFECRSNQYYIPCDSTEIIDDDLKRNSIRIMSGFIDPSGRVNSRVKNSIAFPN